MHWSKDTIQPRHGFPPSSPFHIFLTGGVGTGTSQLIKALNHQACRILQQPGNDPSYPLVLLTILTGTSAYNIGGTTLHAALNFTR